MTLVCFDRDDVLARPLTVQHALCLTPAAATTARHAGLRVTTTLDVFSDRDHARCVAAGRIAVREFDALPLEKLPESVRIMARQSIWIVANIAQRLERTLPIGLMDVRDKAGLWVKAADRNLARATLFPRIIESGLGHHLKGCRPPFGWLHDLTMVVAGRFTPKDATTLVVPAKLKLGFGRAFTERGASVMQIGLTEGHWQDYMSAALALLGRSSYRIVAPARANDRELGDICEILEAAESQLSDARTRHAWRLYGPYLRVNIAGMLGLLRHSKRMTRRAAGAVIGASYEANGWASAALLDAVRQGGGRTLIANHNSHSRSGSAVADAVLGMLYEQRKATQSVDAAVHWSPGDLAFSQQTRMANAVPLARPCRLTYPARRSPQPTRFRILHAANYQNWSDFFPWVAETSDEFVRGIKQLSEAAAGLDGIDLTVRVRPKLEVNAAVVREAIVAADNITISTADDDFLPHLAAHDLLISFFSTTVMQAVQMGKPVLLWGRTSRFHQLSARVTRPTMQDRAAVYVVDDATALRPMLAALRDCHGGRPLEDAECAPYRFGPETPTTEDVAASVLSEMALRRAA